MKPKDAVLFGVTLLALGSGLVAGCSKSGGPTEEKPLPESTAADEAAELVFYGLSGGTEQSFHEQYGKFMRQRFPNYTITFVPNGEGTRLNEMLAAKQQIDVVFNVVEYIPEPLLANGLAYDMTELIKQHNVDLGRIEPALMDGIRLIGDGDIYMLPVTNSSQVMYYNKGIFNTFGVPYPENGMTWEETAELANRMTRSDGEKNILGLSAWPAHILRTNQLSKSYLDAKTLEPTFQDDEWKTMIDSYFVNFARQQTYKDRVAQLKRLPYRQEFANTKELAMFVFYSQYPFAATSEIQQIDWDMASLPTFGGSKKAGSQPSAGAFAIASISKNKSAAMEAIKHLLSDEVQLAWSKQGTMPVVKTEEVWKQFAQDTVFADKNWSAVRYNDFATLAFKSKYELQVQGPLVSAIPQIVTEAADVNTAMRNAAEQAKKLVAEAK